jgi:type IV secretory pathway VirB10-like protein
MEEDLQNKMMVRALTDPKVAEALSNAKTADQGKLLLREVQSLGYLSRALMADIGVTSSQLAMGDRESPVQGMQTSPIGASSAAAPSAAAARPETAATLLKKMPPAPQTRGLPPAMSPRFAPPPPASAAPPSANMYQMLFPDDPISKMMGQRQQPVAPPQ